MGKSDDKSKNADSGIGQRWFNVNKLRQETIDPKNPQNVRNRWYADGSDAYANQGKVIHFEHVPTGRQVYFKAFMTVFNESYNPNWTEETVYGRMDPIYLFKNTTRRLTVGFKIPAATESEAFENLAKLQAFIQFLYPGYQPVGADLSATTIAQSPLLRLKLMNLAANFPKGSTGLTLKGLKEGKSNASKGLLGTLESFNIIHNLNNPDVSLIEFGASGSAAMLSTMIEVDFTFNVVHETPLGWDNTGDGAEATFKSPNFPYGLDWENSKGATKSKALFNQAQNQYDTRNQKARKQRKKRTGRDLPESADNNAKALQAAGLAATMGAFGFSPAAAAAAAAAGGAANQLTDATENSQAETVPTDGANPANESTE